LLLLREDRLLGVMGLLLLLLLPQARREPSAASLARSNSACHKMQQAAGGSAMKSGGQFVEYAVDIVLLVPCCHLSTLEQGLAQSENAR
jgi:hypothetical protein